MLRDFVEGLFGTNVADSMVGAQPGLLISAKESITSEASCSSHVASESEESETLEEAEDPKRVIVVVNNVFKDRCVHEVSELTLKWSDESIEISPSKTDVTADEDALEVTATDDPTVVTLSWSGVSEQKKQEKSSLALSCSETATKKFDRQKEEMLKGDARLTKKIYNDKKTEDCIRELHLRDLYLKEKITKRMHAQQEKERSRRKQQMQLLFTKYLGQDDKPAVISAPTSTSNSNTSAPTSTSNSNSSPSVVTQKRSTGSQDNQKYPHRQNNKPLGIQDRSNTLARKLYRYNRRRAEI